MEKDGYIKGYTTIVDKKKMGFGLIAFCSVTLESHHTEFLKKIEAEILQLPQVMQCYHIAGMFDYLLKILAKDMVDYQYFISHKLASVSSIRRVQSSFIMTEVKNEKVFPK